MVSSPWGALLAPFDCETSLLRPEQPGAVFRKGLKLRRGKYLPARDREF